jgi:hypothetical protein
MQVNLKIEILKVFELNFSFCSNKKIKDGKDAKTSDGTNAAPDKQPPASK